MSARVRTAVLGVLTVAVVGGLGIAHASSLTVAGPALTTTTATACTTSALTVQPTDPRFFGFLGYDGVQVTVPTSCVGKAFALTVYDTSGGAVQATASTTIASTTVSLSTSASYGGWFQASPSVATTIDGWSVPASF